LKGVVLKKNAPTGKYMCEYLMIINHLLMNGADGNFG